MPLPGGGPVGRAILALLLSERERWPLWLPPLYGAGAATYLILRVEPPPGLLAAASILCLSASLFIWRTWPHLLAIALIPGLLVAGFAAMAVRTHWVAEPVIADETLYSDLRGRVAAVEPFETGPRVVLTDLSAAHLDPDAAPRSVRLRLRRGETVRPGDWIAVAAKLRPPPSPSFPGAYDFARSAWFYGLGGVGFAMSRIQTIPPVRDVSLSSDVSAAINRTRMDLAATLRRADRAGLWSAPATGGIAAALVTGDRSGVPETVQEDLRIAGLAHLLAISGLHIGLVAGAVFVFCRACLATSRLALRHPIKKWAACVATVAAFGYLLLSGATVPTQRAFVMTGLVMLAVLIDRRALSMRLVAVAAAVILLMTPEQSLNAGFQMSFAAVAGLIALFETIDPARRGPLGEEGLVSALGPVPRQLLLYLAVVLLTTVVATAATAPFALYHFGRVANYGLVANLIAVPIMAFWVMPVGLVAVLLAPLGLSLWPAVAMGWGIEAILAVAATVSDWPHAATTVGALPDWAPAVAVAGGLWLVIWRRRWRFLGLLPVLVAIFSAWAVPVPTAIVSETGRLAGVTWNGGLWLSNLRRETFAAGVWHEKLGVPVKGDWRALAALPHSPLRCDALGCVMRHQGLRLAVSYGARGLGADCARTDIVISKDRRPFRLCRSTPFVGPFERYLGGAHTVRLSRDGPVIDSVGRRRGVRPWTGTMAPVSQFAVSTSATTRPAGPER